MDETLRYLLAASFLKGMGSSRIRQAIALLGDVSLLFTLPFEQLEQLPFSSSVFPDDSVRVAALVQADGELDFIDQHQIRAFTFLDAHYPLRLKECADAPLFLFVKGNTDLNRGHLVGVVGTRRATSYGKTECEKFVTDLAALYPKAIVVSGLAYGIDVTAHRAALECGLTTIGVVGHGLDTIYPAQHHSVASRIVNQGGAIVTEYMSHTLVDSAFFVQRNRIIAGLTDAVVVVESAQKGGALITARVAQDYNREVFAFPGRVDDEFSVGCNNLIKHSDAQLIESADDFVSYMGWNRQGEPSRQQSLFVELNEQEQQVVQLLRGNKLHLDVLTQQLHLTIAQTMSLMVQMEFKGLVQALPGGMFTLV